MRKIDLYYRNQINRGRAEVVGEYVYSSSYDVGEGWASFDIAPCCDFTQELFNLNVYTAGPANSLSVRAAVAGNAPNARSVRVKLFGNTVYDHIMNFFGTAVIDVNNLPLILLQSTSYVPVYVNNNSSVTNDRIVVASLGITYPATFNFNNQKNFYFDLAPSATGNKLEIENVNYGTVPPILYDNTSVRRYIGSA